MTNVLDFIGWGLGRVNPASVPDDALLPILRDEVGVDPWHYLFGSVRVFTTKAVIEYFWEHHYKTRTTRKHYDEVTASWRATDCATDCEGFLDAYRTYVLGIKTDISADYNYEHWCEDKGKISEIDREWVLGEAVFEERYSSTKGWYKNHIGWICGYMPDGEPLVMEARGLDYGVVVTKLSERVWKYRGLMTKVFEYKEEPTMSWLGNAEAIKALQNAMNLNGIVDYEGKALVVDGKWGTRSQSAFENMCREHGPEPEVKHVEVYLDGTLKSSFDVYAGEED